MSSIDGIANLSQLSDLLTNLTSDCRKEPKSRQVIAKYDSIASAIERADFSKITQGTITILANRIKNGITY